VKISIIKPDSVNVDPWVPAFRDRKIEVCENFVEPDCDVILCASHSQISKLAYYHKLYPTIPIINYNWDLYGWVFTNPRGYDWATYGEFLKISDQIWCPSEEVVLRTEEFFGVGDRCRIVKTFARFFDHDDVCDKRYILNPMRGYASDKNMGWLRKACTELNIPLVESGHKLTEEQFKRTVAHCTFMCTEYEEASTGGLTLLEGFRLGKPVVVSDSIYMGARDYFGDHAIYFNNESYEDFKQTIKNTWENTPTLSLELCRKITDQYTLDNMVDEMHKNLKQLLRSRKR
tara:strand:+ start:3435 stop:4298 length:864 start_codon:yes stop_codon:yes gene_type:complete